MDLHQGSGVSGKRASPHLKHAGDDSQLPGRWQVITRSIWIIWTLVNLICFIAGIFAYRNLLQTTCVNTSQQQCLFWQLTPGNLQALAHAGLSPSAYVSYFLTVVIISSLIFWLVGLFIFWHRSNTWIGLFASFILVSFGAAGTSDILSTAFQQVDMLPTAVNMVLNALGSALWPLFGLFLLVFPDGRLRPRWSWIVLLLWIVQLVCFLLPPPWNILYWPSPLFVAELLLTYGSTVATQIVRYLHFYDPMQRQQSKWLVFGLATCLLLNALYYVAGSVIPGWNHPDSLYLLANGTVTSLLFVAIPLAIGMAILRYRLWDIDLIINRSLVYTALTVCVIGGYTLTVVTLGTLLQRQGDLFISLFTTGLIALIFHPLRERLQRAANRLMYGERDDPYAVLSRLGSRMEATLAPDAVLSTIVETVALALKLPYAAITLKRGDTPIGTASFGEQKDQLLHLPLLYQTEQIGELALAPRALSGSFTPADHRLLVDFARQAGIAAHAVQLTAELQHSRERLVTAREEERRRLRRDLHDGLGPTLGALTLKVGSARSLYHHDPAAADGLMAELESDIAEAIIEIRRLVYALRPPALDDIGLLAAIEECALQYQQISSPQGLSQPLHITVQAPDPLPALPAAVEVATYRIAQEALTNVARHAHARTCLVRFQITHVLQLEIIDDGVGLPMNLQRGVGLTSMHERAVELGGTYQIEALPTGGTRVLARLPLPKEQSNTEEQRILQRAVYVPSDSTSLREVSSLEEHHQLKDGEKQPL